jgi:hypothetical protein
MAKPVGPTRRPTSVGIRWALAGGLDDRTGNRADVLPGEFAG